MKVQNAIAVFMTFLLVCLTIGSGGSGGGAQVVDRRGGRPAKVSAAPRPRGAGAKVVDQAGEAQEDWALEHLEILDHSEAELLVRHGSINNLGFGWPRGFDPFSGASTPAHGYPWPANPKAAQGTDRIMVVSSYRGKSPFHPDGYTNTTSRPDNNPVPIPIIFMPPKFPIHAAVLQVFVDDFQAPFCGSRFQATMNGWRVPEFEAILNSLNQTGPIGKLVTYQLPAQVVKTLDTGQLTILVDDPTTGTGEGYAFDFFRLLINPRGRKYRGTLTGYVLDEAEGKPLGGATVSAGGVVTTQTAADGTYKLDGVPAGLATVIFAGDCYERKTITTDLLAGQIQRVDARLKPVTRASFLEAEDAFLPRRAFPAEEPKKPSPSIQDSNSRVGTAPPTDLSRVTRKELPDPAVASTPAARSSSSAPAAAAPPSQPAGVSPVGLILVLVSVVLFGVGVFIIYSHIKQ